MKNKFFGGGITAFISFLLSIPGLSQTSILGPTCVTNGIAYLYAINGKTDTNHVSKICVTGGVIDSINTICVESKSLKFVKIAWDSAVTTGVLQFTSSSGTATLRVIITHALSEGNITTGELFQGTDSTKIPVGIHCTAATGGSCHPFYTYQWEQSADNISWTNLNGSTQQHLLFTAPVRQTTYFRRKVKAVGSDAIAYTQSAAVFINPIVNQ